MEAWRLAKRKMTLALFIILLLALLLPSRQSVVSVPTEKRNTYTKACPRGDTVLFPLDKNPTEWQGCGDAYEYSWTKGPGTRDLSGLSEVERLQLSKSMGYCPHLRCQLGTVGNANPDGSCPEGLCFTKLQDGAPTFGGCCYTSGKFNSGQMIGYLNKQRPMQKPIYKTNRVVLGGGLPGTPGADEGEESFINANEVFPGVLVTQCPLLGRPYDQSERSTLPDWRRMVREQNVSLVVQLHPYVVDPAGVEEAFSVGDEEALAAALAPASGCKGRAEIFCKVKCENWAGTIFSEPTHPLSMGGEDAVTGWSRRVVPDLGRVEYEYMVGEEQAVRHLWYYRWKDFETPGQQDAEGVLSLARETAAAMLGGERVLVVCYSGRGRSGALIAAAQGIAGGFTTNRELVRSIVEMRETRDSMLETPSQLLLVRQLLQLPDTPHLGGFGATGHHWKEGERRDDMQRPLPSIAHDALRRFIYVLIGAAVAAGLLACWQWESGVVGSGTEQAGSLRGEDGPRTGKVTAGDPRLKAGNIDHKLD